ncbi:hypothetical protein Glove_399g42 [Diversispora epigaea]|uniref:Uncharacterized protein n=1 Tax=Diversispora epigaea TaxID=1348612 RepID=A0A397H1R2_9GLOM|nr:hypothetical protein Glove_399g42 [Diversispora epigaea]
MIKPSYFFPFDQCSSGRGNKEGREAEAEEGRKAEAEEGREAEAEEEAREYEETTSVNFFKRKPSKSFISITFEYLQHKRNIYEGYWYRKPSFLLIKRNTPEVIDIDNLQ